MKIHAYHYFFKKLANPLRINIISSLAKKPKMVNELAIELRTEQSKLSHALKELSSCYIVEAKRKGKKKIYKLSKTILPILKLIDKHSKKYCKFCMYRK